jgi:hypothetical protein
MTICLYKVLTQRSLSKYGAERATMRPDLDLSSCERSEIVRRRTEEERAEVFFPVRATTGRIREVRAVDLQEEMAERGFSVPPDPTKTAASWRTSQRAERAIEHGAMREQLERKESHE